MFISKWVNHTLLIKITLFNSQRQYLIGFISMLMKTNIRQIWLDLSPHHTPSFLRDRFDGFVSPSAKTKRWQIRPDLSHFYLSSILKNKSDPMPMQRRGRRRQPVLSLTKKRGQEEEREWRGVERIKRYERREGREK